MTRVTWRAVLGLFLTALATLMHEILLTRIFSVTMWYHFAFVAVSLAMFGMTVGAIIVFVRPGWFSGANLGRRLAIAAVTYPVLLVFTFLVQLSVPFFVHLSVVGLFSIAFVYTIVSVPFIASGIVICLMLTRFPSRVSQLYAADLAGAALGCVLLVILLPATDGPTALLVIAALAALGGVLFAFETPSRRLRGLAVTVLVVLIAASAAHAALVWRQFPVFRILWAKGAFEPRPLYEAWNSYSRVRVIGDPKQSGPPFARSISPVYPKDRQVRELRLDIDVAASTFMLGFSGDESEVDFLKYDVTNIGHHVRPDGETLVIGTGGARDVVAALVFGAKAVTGVEINGQILDIVNGPFGDYSGHLDRNPRVQFVNDEARSYLARTDRSFDLIQISLIDTWAATAAGAFVLTENSLYTVEAWTTFLKRLTDGGLLSVCRWSMESQPAEVYRLVSLAVEALEVSGAQNPREHLVLVRAPTVDGVSIATLLVSGTPINRRDLDVLARVAGDLRFEVMMSPDVATDPMLAKLASISERREVVASFPLDISAPTDDRPFFFQMLRMRDFFRNERIVGIKLAPNLEAVLVLGTLLATVIGLSVICIFVPLALTAERSVLSGNGALLGFFTSIGLGFMTIETAQMQRLIVALGHPTYGLTVVLFTLLLSSGLGSYLTAGISGDRLAIRGARRLTALVALLVIVGIITPPIMLWVEAEATIVRIGVAAALLLPIGAFMGMAFPLGMKLAARSADKLAPWLWGVNGATSVSAAVLAIVIALSTSISTAYWVGVAAYVGATVSWWSATRSRAT